MAFVVDKSLFSQYVSTRNDNTKTLLYNGHEALNNLDMWGWLSLHDVCEGPKNYRLESLHKEMERLGTHHTDDTFNEVLIMLKDISEKIVYLKLIDKFHQSVKIVD